jgi:predicted dienelactone hydrolase
MQTTGSYKWGGCFGRGLQILAGLILAILISFLVLMLVLWATHNRVVNLPAISGPYAVGRIGYDWVDETHLETLTKDPNDHRELAVWIWYPAESVSGAKTTDYLPQDWWQKRNEQMGILAKFLAQNQDKVRVHAVDGATLSTRQTAYPVLVFEPGLGPIASDYTWLAEELTSHGYVVVGVTPTYSAGVVVFTNGRTVFQFKSGGIAGDATPEETQNTLNELIQVWAGDASFALDQMQKLNSSDPSGRFNGRISLTLARMFGHSFGGAASAEALMIDPRFKAGANLDGYPYGEVVQKGLDQPFMFLWSEPPDSTDPGGQKA